MRITVKDEHDMMLLKNYILGVCGISHKLLTRLKGREDGILLNRRRVTVRAVIKAGDLIELALEDEEGSDILPIKTSPMPEVIYEDEDMMVLNKPPFMPTHPSHGHYEDTLANAVAYIFAQRGESRRFRAITRLDRNTSGVVLLAKNAKSAAMLSSMMQKGRITKKYIALCEGSTPSSFTVNKNIKREKESIITRVVCESDEGQSALTLFEKVCESDGISVLSVTPLTGRTHQIRVHLAHVGFPILGDDIYGKPSERISRHALHAKSLTLDFSDGRAITFEAPPACDMEALIHPSEKTSTH